MVKRIKDRKIKNYFLFLKNNINAFFSIDYIKRLSGIYNNWTNINNHNQFKVILTYKNERFQRYQTSLKFEYFLIEILF